VLTVVANRDWKPDGGVVVYNFQVEGDHTYFVGDIHAQGNWVWTHNACAVDTNPLTKRLTNRADEVHALLDHPKAINGRTTAVLATSGGDIVAGGVRDLSPLQRAALAASELPAKLAGEHAEVTALAEASRRGLTPKAIAASRPFCKECIKALLSAGAQITGARTATWG